MDQHEALSTAVPRPSLVTTSRLQAVVGCQINFEKILYYNTFFYTQCCIMYCNEYTCSNMLYSLVLASVRAGAPLVFLKKKARTCTETCSRSRRP